jgi:hypothetical protein
LASQSIINISQTPKLAGGVPAAGVAALSRQ